ncbi:hypothetical protein ACOJA5_11365, partial [Corynebacterium striatum]
MAQDTAETISATITVTNSEACLISAMLTSGDKDTIATITDKLGPDPRKVDTSGVSYAAWVSVADVSASKSLGARRLHQECRLRV